MSEHSRQQRYREKHRAQRKQAHEVSMAFIHSQRLGKVCAMCGEPDTSKLDFHHIDSATKSCDVSQMGGLAKERILSEIAKCKPCHGKHHNPA